MQDNSQENNICYLLDGRQIGYAKYGDPSGVPFFFFHAYPGSRFHGKMFDSAAKRLGILILSIDRPGYGLSDFQNNRSLLDWTDDIMEIADLFNIKKFSVLGISGGGPYAAACAYKIPDRIINVGIIVGLAPLTVEANLQKLSLFVKTAWKLSKKYSVFQKIIASMYIAQTKNLLPDSFFYSLLVKSDKNILANGFKQEMERNRKEAFRQGIKGTKTDLKIYSSDWGFPVRAIKTKTHLWYGEVDNVVPSTMGNYYASQLKKSNLIIYPGEGHLLAKTHSEEILKTLRDS